MPATDSMVARASNGAPCNVLNKPAASNDQSHGRTGAPSFTLRVAHGAGPKFTVNSSRRPAKLNRLGVIGVPSPSQKKHRVPSI